MLFRDPSRENKEVGLPLSHTKCCENSLELRLCGQDLLSEVPAMTYSGSSISEKLFARVLLFLGKD